MGLERLAVVVQDVDSLFTVDTNKALLDAVCAMAHTEYLADEKKDVAKLLASHNVVMTGLYEAGETLEDTFLELMKD